MVRILKADQNENELKNLIDFNATDVEDGTTQSRFTWRLMDLRESVTSGLSI